MKLVASRELLPHLPKMRARLFYQKCIPVSSRFFLPTERKSLIRKLSDEEMWAVALVALLGVAAAVPSSIQLKEATLLVQRPRQEGHAKNWNLEAQQHGQKCRGSQQPISRLKAAL